MKDKVLKFLEKEEYCVISTVNSEGRPESALVAFSERPNLEIMLGTSKESRKFKNLVSNPHVSLVFGPQNNRAIQYEGIAKELKGDELREEKRHHFKKQPGSIKYESDPNQAYLLVTPKWIRLVESGPNVVDEMGF